MPGAASGIWKAIEADLRESGVEHSTEPYGPRLEEHERYGYLRPTVVHCESPAPAIAKKEYMFPFTTVVKCPQEQMIETVGPTLVCTAITNNESFQQALVDATHIDRLNLGPIPTTKLNWLQPHEGNIVDFLFRAGALQIAARAACQIVADVWKSRRCRSGTSCWTMREAPTAHASVIPLEAPAVRSAIRHSGVHVADNSRATHIVPPSALNDSLRLPSSHADRLRPREGRCAGRIGGRAGARRVLVVSDPGIVAAGHTERGLAALRRAGIETHLFDGVAENPTTENVEAGLALARRYDPELLVGLGGGSSMDCAKGINFLVTNGGRMQDYWGVGKATRPMLPMIAVPTTAGTGSETQSFALISDAKTHVKMACGDKKASFRVALLDPDAHGDAAARSDGAHRHRRHRPCA